MDLEAIELGGERRGNGGGAGLAHLGDKRGGSGGVGVDDGADAVRAQIVAALAERLTWLSALTGAASSALIRQ